MKQKVSHFRVDDDMVSLLDGIQRAADKGYTVQAMTTVGFNVIVVFNVPDGLTQHLKNNSATVYRDTSQFADRPGGIQPYS